MLKIGSYLRESYDTATRRHFNFMAFLNLQL